MDIQQALFGAVQELLTTNKITLEELTSHVNQTYAAFNGNTMNDGKVGKYVARQFGAENIAVLSSEAPNSYAVYQDIVGFFLDPKSGYRLIWHCNEREDSEFMRFFLPLFENTYLIPEERVNRPTEEAKQPVFWGIGCDIGRDKVSGKIHLSFDTVQSKPNEDIDPLMGFESHFCMDINSSLGQIKGLAGGVYVAFNDNTPDGSTVSCPLLGIWKICDKIPASLADAVTYIEKKNMTWFEGYKFLRPEVTRVCLPLQRYVFERSMNLDVDNTNYYNFILK